MRRSAPRVLTAVALAGAALGLAAPGVSAAADPAARVEPGAATPGGTVTVSVSCDAVGDAPPASIEATSRGFEEGRVMLHRVDATGTAALTYTGTAQVPADDAPDAVPEPGEWSVDGACPAAPGGAQEQWSTSFGLDGGEAEGADPGDPGVDPQLAQEPPAAVPGTGTGSGTGADDTDTGAAARPRPSASAPSHRPAAPATEAPSAGVQHGVEAGRGGAFTDSVPAMAAGALLMAGAFGAAVHRLRRRLADPRR
ncbi:MULTISPECIES: hypothetical protein [unclassified Streptomyces]|uniref:hypothetical protein n=1 Tax=unclassified Streptomyces TaxID=2593676 RepID=UPI0004C22870|nr:MULTISPECIES: hypothetical protein [unclassified Streptomyces]